MSEENIRKIGEFLELKYVIARDVNKNDKLETQDKYIQMLYDGYLDLKIKYNQLQQENKLLCEQLDEQNDLANEYYKRIDKAIKNLKTHLEAKSYGNHKYELFDRKYLEEQLKILEGDK